MNDPEDLWDFGTVRHSATVGRKQTSIVVSGPPLTWENNGTTRSDGSSSSGHHSFTHKDRVQAASYIDPANAKGELPPLPPTPKKYDAQGTVRQANNRLAKELSDEYDDDFEDQDLDIRNHHPQGEDDLPDTTMLDSVVLPAIASVSRHYIVFRNSYLNCRSFSLVYPRKKRESRSVPCSGRSLMPNA